MAACHRPDLMIVDVNLASGAGAVAVQRITQAKPVPHLFISGRNPQAPLSSAVLLVRTFQEADFVCAIGRALGSADTSA